MAAKPPPKRFQRPSVAKPKGSVTILPKPGTAAANGANAAAPTTWSLNPGGEVDLDEVAARYNLVAGTAWLERRDGQMVMGSLQDGAEYVVCGDLDPATAAGPTGAPPYTAAKDDVLIGFSEVMLLHDTDLERHMEKPSRAARAWERVQEAGLLDHVEVLASDGTSGCESLAATPEQVLRVHAADRYADFLQGTPFPVESLPGDTYCSQDSVRAALVAAGTCAAAAEQIMSGKRKHAFCIVRPPGHHCPSAAPRGFCLLNNVAIAARDVQARHPGAKVAILDFDVHHGDGTQEVFDEDPSVLYLSLHRYDNKQFFPYTGGVGDIGTGPGAGYCINCPFDTRPKSSSTISDMAFAAVTDRVFVPVLQAFQPDIVLVSAGFDAGVGDPLGRMDVVHGFAYMTNALKAVAGGRLLLALEGGYNLETVATATVSCVQTLLGLPVPALSFPQTFAADAAETARHQVWIDHTLRTVAGVHRAEGLPFAALFDALHSAIPDVAPAPLPERPKTVAQLQAAATAEEEEGDQ